MSRDLLLEIGAEELPASFVTHALSVMKSTAERLLEEARLSPSGEIRTYGTPRRLALLLPGLPPAQPDRRETVMGPPASAALKPDGSFGPAAEGFAKKQGVGVDAIRVVETPKGKYVAVEIAEQGRDAVEVLPGLLATLCQRITFPKAMRWGEGDHAFGRPIHWVVALYGTEVVSFDFAGVTSGRSTRGHRFLASAPFELASAAEYLDKLRDAHVLVDVAERRATMLTKLESAAAALGGVLEPDAFLLDECQSLVEEPHVVPGTIDARFLDLPDDVIVSVMRTHQRYFAVRKADGTLAPSYLNVVNTANAPETIAKGNDRVLRARLNDAAFFVREDRKKNAGEYKDRLEVLDRVVFQAKLGSVGAKVRRVAEIAQRVGGPEHAADARQAALLCKADLTSYIVGEFPELQGSMGRFYALENGIAQVVADALRDHYKPAGAEDSLPPTEVSAAVAIADRIDTLVGCFGIGLVPSGSADPFALRRATLGIVRIAVDGPLDVDVHRLIVTALDFYDRSSAGSPLTKSREEVVAALEEFFRGRLRAYYRERFPGDVVDACLDAWEFGSVRDLDARMKALEAFRGAPEYASLAVAFKRAWNIAKDVPEGSIDEARLEDGAERDLYTSWHAAAGRIEAAVSARRYEEALRTVAVELRGPIDTFFEKVFVMVDDVAVRDNRLRLLRSIAYTVQRIAHFHLLAP